MAEIFDRFITLSYVSCISITFSIIALGVIFKKHRQLKSPCAHVGLASIGILSAVSSREPLIDRFVDESAVKFTYVASKKKKEKSTEQQLYILNRTNIRSVILFTPWETHGIIKTSALFCVLASFLALRVFIILRCVRRKITMGVIHSIYYSNYLNAGADLSARLSHCADVTSVN